MDDDVDLVEFVCSTIALACNRSAVEPQARLLDLNMDSLTFVSVLAQIEAVYDVELDPDERLELLTAVQVSELIGRLQHIVRRSSQGATALPPLVR